MAARFAYLDHDGPLAFAHRGGGAEQPENTWSAFAHAVQLGYRYLELDVQVTTDDVPVVFHDPTLDRVTNRSGPIRSYRWPELQRITLADGEPPVALADLLAAWPDRHFNVDVKQAAALEPTAAAVEAGRARSRVCLTGFSAARLRWMRQRLGPDLCTGVATSGVALLRAASLLPARLAAATWAAGAAQVPTHHGVLPLVDRRLLACAHRLGLQVHVWTVNDRATMEALLDLGVDGIMTDRPSLLRDVLHARGCWS